MTKLDPAVKKEIVRSIHAAIDSEMCSRDNEAYSYYIQSLKLVTGVLGRDISENNVLTYKDKKNLIEFAKQSIGRLAYLVQQQAPHSEEKIYPIQPSAPQEPPLNFASPTVPQFYNITPQEIEEKEKDILSKYQQRIGYASTPLERQNLELEMARQLVENAAITRNRLMQATAWAMQTAHRQFHIQEKLCGGTLKESDFKKQQLFALALQSMQGNSWLTQYIQDLKLYPNNKRLVRELVETVLSDNAHPIRCCLLKMQAKIQSAVPQDPSSSENNFEKISREIKEDLNILYEVLINLFEPLNTESNSQITSDVLYHFYFKPLKQSLICLIRQNKKETEQSLLRRMETGCKDGCCVNLNEDAKKEAITKLHYLTTLHNPYDMVECLVNVVKLLTTSEFDKNHFTSLGADDLLPRLCEVLIQSRLGGLCAESYFMETFMPAEKSLNEEGYAVTMLQSVIAHLTTN